MKLRFTKMEGAGNDFVVLDFTHRAFELKNEQIKKMADRHFGVGADQVLVVEKTDKPGLDFRICHAPLGRIVSERKKCRSHAPSYRRPIPPHKVQITS